MHAHTSTIQKIFGYKLFASPVDVASSWGAKAATTYGHVSAGTFPIKLTKICGRQMVDLQDFIMFLEGHIEADSCRTPTISNTAKRGRGRRAKKSSAENISSHNGRSNEKTNKSKRLGITVKQLRAQKIGGAA